MRKQYHFHPAATGEHWDAWDVERLIRSSAGLAVVDVPVESITEVDTDYWTDAGSEPTVRRVLGHMRMVLDVDPGYPIILGADGRVMDGMHRVCRAILDGRASIAARRFTVDPDPDHRNVRFTDLTY